MGSGLSCAGERQRAAITLGSVPREEAAGAVSIPQARRLGEVRKERWDKPVLRERWVPEHGCSELLCRTGVVLSCGNRLWVTFSNHPFSCARLKTQRGHVW